jgi:hypothetical protein
LHVQLGAMLHAGAELHMRGEIVVCSTRHGE